MCACACVCEVKRERLIIDNRIVYIRSLDRKLCLFEPATQGSQTWFALSHPAPVLHDLKKKKKKKKEEKFFLLLVQQGVNILEITEEEVLAKEFLLFLLL